ncbi:MAG TPA: thioredoxin-disulfide reductase [candidate division Zixibacteria bacterium]|nr:thioredoxin-disulfide reductase [candidate division Zixibacteria bacterium]
MAEVKDYDVIIVGGGPGGLCAGMYSARANRKTVVLEKYLPGGQIAVTGEVEDYPGFEHIHGAELAMKFTDHAKKFGLEIEMEEVEELYVDGEYRTARCASGNLYRGKAAILSTGGSPVFLNIPGEKEFSGKGVSYCAICDGAFFKDQIIAVVGGGDAAVEEGTYLTKFATKVYIIHRRDQLRAAKIIQQRAFDNPKVEFIWNTVVDSIHGDDRKVSHLSLRDVNSGEKRTLEVGAIFPYIGFKPNSSITREKLKTDDNGYIITDFKMETSVPGIFACGDVRAQLVRQVTNAVGDGTTAAVAAEKYIESMEDKIAHRV